MVRLSIGLVSRCFSSIHDSLQLSHSWGVDGREVCLGAIYVIGVPSCLVPLLVLCIGDGPLSQSLHDQTLWSPPSY